jgi:hypothetical protein
MTARDEETSGTGRRGAQTRLGRTEGDRLDSGDRRLVRSGGGTGHRGVGGDQRLPPWRDVVDHRSDRFPRQCPGEPAGPGRKTGTSGRAGQLAGRRAAPGRCRARGRRRRGPDGPGTGRPRLYRDHAFGRLGKRRPLYDAAANVEGTRRVLAAARVAGGRGGLHEQQGRGDGRVGLVAEQPVGPPALTDRYTRSKPEAEALVLAAAAEGMAAMVVNPVGISGPARASPSAPTGCSWPRRGVRSRRSWTRRSAGCSRRTPPPDPCSSWNRASRADGACRVGSPPGSAESGAGVEVRQGP